MLQRFRTDVEGWVHDSLQGESVSRNDIPQAFQLPDTLTPVVIREEDASRQPESAYKLFQISEAHRRSYELGDSSHVRAGLGAVAVWHDEFGNAFTSYSLKGNNNALNSVTGSLTAPSGYMAMGLLESDSLLRVVRSSRLLRQAGVSTEWVNRIFEPQMLIYKGERIDQAEYKRRLLADSMAQYGFEEMGRVAAAIEPLTFFITGRSIEIGDRLADFMNDTPEQAHVRLGHIFNVYNQLHSDDAEFEPLDIASAKDIERYFIRVFPRLLGENLAKMHHAGIVHSFPHMGNVTALGGLVDLDSLKGMPLHMDDPEITITDMTRDLYETNNEEVETNAIAAYRALKQLGFLSKRSPHLDAEITLMDHYTKTRSKLDGDDATHKDKIYLYSFSAYLAAMLSTESLKAIALPAYDEAADIVWDTINENIMTARQPENFSRRIKYLIDRELDRAFKAGELSIDLLSDEKTIRRITRKLLAHMSTTTNFLTNTQQLLTEGDLQLKEVIPEDDIRLRIIKGLIFEVVTDYAEQAQKDNTKVVMNRTYRRFRRTLRKEIAGSTAGYKETHFQPYLPTVMEIGAEPIQEIMFQGRLVQAYRGISLKQLLNDAHAAGIPIEQHFFRVSEENFDSSSIATHAPQSFVRASISNFDGLALRQVHYTKSGTELSADCSALPTVKDLYMAWLHEDKARQHPYLEIQAESSTLEDAIESLQDDTIVVKVVDMRDKDVQPE